MILIILIIFKILMILIIIIILIIVIILLLTSPIGKSVSSSTFIYQADQRPIGFPRVYTIGFSRVYN